MEFKLNEKEEKTLKEFEKKHRHPEINKGAIGGHIDVIFTCTSLGALPSVKCTLCGEEESICDYDKI